jgi:hypothetical protein
VAAAAKNALEPVKNRRQGGFYFFRRLRFSHAYNSTLVSVLPS